MANSKSGTGRQAQLAAYKIEKRMERNRRVKLERALKRNPENKQIELALKGICYRRKTPKVPYWSHSMISLAKLYKKFTGNFNPDIFSKNEKLSGPALMTHGTFQKSKAELLKEKSMSKEKSMFSLGARAVLEVSPTWS